MKIDDEDHTLILLCSFLYLVRMSTFVDTMLYGRDTTFMEDAKASLNSKELTKKVFENWVKNQSSAFVARGRGKKKGESRNSAKLKNRKGSCNYYHQPRH